MKTVLVNDLIIVISFSFEYESIGGKDNICNDLAAGCSESV